MKTTAQQLSEMSDVKLRNEYNLGRRSIFFVQDVKTEIDNRLSKININDLQNFLNSSSCADWPFELLYEEMTKRTKESNQQPKSAVQPSFDAEHALYTLYNELPDDVDMSGGIADTQDFRNWLDQYNEKMDNKHNQLKQQALAKLTDKEKTLLGLK